MTNRSEIIADPKRDDITRMLETSGEPAYERLSDDYHLDTHAHVIALIQGLDTLTRPNGVNKQVDPISYKDALLRPAGEELHKIGGERLIHGIFFVLTTLFGKRLVKFPKRNYTESVEDCLKEVWDGLGFDCLA